nr:immunoglobulin light chain junction region [Macaca mulatta]MPN83058.1 immunoglobulin light chain junction region [Macaca mulatta]
CQQGYSYPLTC